MNTTEPTNICTTCRSEIVETIIESVFRDGECGGCEYQRYRSQFILQEVCERELAGWQLLRDGEYDCDEDGIKTAIDDLQNALASVPNYDPQRLTQCEATAESGGGE